MTVGNYKEVSLSKLKRIMKNRKIDVKNDWALFQNTLLNVTNVHICNC